VDNYDGALHTLAAKFLVINMYYLSTTNQFIILFIKHLKGCLKVCSSFDFQTENILLHTSRHLYKGFQTPSDFWAIKFSFMKVVISCSV